MRIGNVNDFFQFIRAHGLQGISPETQNLVSCMEAFGRMCPCDPPATRDNQFNTCKRLYIMFARKASAYKSQLMSKTNDATIEFSSDGQYVATVSRH